MGKEEYNCCETSRELIERRNFVGPMSESGRIMAALHADNWRIIRSGPYTDRAMFPDVDITRFLFLAERADESLRLYRDGIDPAQVKVGEEYLVDSGGEFYVMIREEGCWFSATTGDRWCGESHVFPLPPRKESSDAPKNP